MFVSMVTVATLVLSLAAHVAAQEPLSSSEATPAQGRVVIDGAKTPELISDRTIVYGVLSRWPIPPSASPAEARLLRSRAGRMKLGSADTEILLTEAARAYPGIAAARARLQAAARGDGKEAVLAMKQLQDASWEMYGRLLEFLSPDGSQNLRAHVEYLKSQTRVFGPDPEVASELVRAIERAKRDAGVR
jgi:hypothetical protein